MFIKFIRGIVVDKTFHYIFNQRIFIKLPPNFGEFSHD